MSLTPVWLDGELRPAEDRALSPFDRGFTLADGVFETLRARAQAPLWLEDHLARLRGGAAVLGIPVPLGDDAIARGLVELLEAGGHPASAVRLTLSRGPSEKRGLWPPTTPPRPTLLATVAPLPPARAALKLAVAESTRRNEHSPLARIKSLNYGDNLIARREADARGMDDALMMNSRGRIVCATVGNLFVRLSGRWRTAPIAEGALPGLARARLVKLLDAEETAIARADLARVQAGFLSNSLSLTAIREIDGRALEDASAALEALALFAT
ncbi:MAG TPA: aminotransferase class IV [Alphaproteobacteria bacterium]|nr:aminotransferase class IV [Alphaproteobacteria bacterium]